MIAAAAVLGAALSALGGGSTVSVSWGSGNIGFLRRIPAHRVPPLPIVPVILFQDLGTSPALWEMQGGLAPALVKAGFEVWTVEFSWDRLATLESYATQIVGEAVHAVQAETHRRPLLVGFGWGGRAVLEWLASGGEAPRAALLATPAVWTIPNESVRQLLAEALAGSETRSVRFSDLSGAGQKALDAVLFNDGLPEEARIRKTFLDEVARPIPRSLLREVLAGGGEGEGGTVSAKGLLVPPVADLDHVRTPVLFLTGQIDAVCPPWLSAPGLEPLGPWAQWRMFGRINADRRELGHLGLVAGEDARDEVEPILIRWLRGQPWRWFRSEETFF